MPKRRTDDMSRAEKIRARRQESRKKPQVNPFGSNATRKQSQHRVPVSKRQPDYKPAIYHQRHKVHVPLKTKGAELHVPSLLRVQLGTRLVSGLLFILSLAIVISFSSLKAFTINAIELRGAQQLGENLILSETGLEGTSIISVQPDVIEKRLMESFPSLREVSVTLALPAAVTIQVIERQPLILWQQDSTSLWIDAEGIMFPIIGDAEISQIVAANSNPPAPPAAVEIEVNEENFESLFFDNPTYPQTTPDFVQGILSLSEFIPEGSYLQYDPRFGLGWDDPKGWLVYFGKDTSDIDIKLAEYEKIIAAMQEEQITPSLISLEFLHAPFYRMEQ